MLSAILPCCSVCYKRKSRGSFAPRPYHAAFFFAAFYPPPANVFAVHTLIGCQSARVMLAGERSIGVRLTNGSRYRVCVPNAPRTVLPSRLAFSSAGLLNG